MCTIAVAALLKLIAVVALASQGKIAVSEVSATEVSFPKSISAPLEITLKWVALPGAAII